MTLSKIFSYVCCLTAVVSAFGQSAPTIVSILNGGDFSNRLSPGVIAAVYGTNFGTGPTSSVTATVGGKQAFIRTVTANQLTIQVPVDAPVGPTIPITPTGASPGAFYQVNFVVPGGLQGTQPVVLTIMGKSSSPVSVYLFGISSVVSNAGALAVISTLLDVSD